jgi:hypothetical protein
MSDMTIPSREHVIRRRLWKSGGLLAIFILTLFVGNFFLPPQRAVTRDMLGHDFLAFYSAGAMARHGDFRDLYDLTSIKAAESATGHAAGLTVGFGPYWNPPFAAWFFAPFTFLPFKTALLIWEFTGAAALIASIILLSRLLPDSRNWRNWGLIVLLMLASNPLVAVFTHGQNTFITLLLLSIVATLWRARQAVLAGAVAGLLLYKPQHAAIIACVLVACLGWRSAVGLAATTAALAAVTVFTMPGAASDYLHKLPQLVTVMQEQSPYAWDRHVTLKAFWRLLLQGTDAGPMRRPTWILWWSSELLVVGILTRVVWQARRDPAQTDRVIATAIAASPLLVPFFFDYDLLILAIPAVLCAGHAMRFGADRRLLMAWIALFISLHIDPQMARPMHFVLATPALVLLVACLSYPPRLRRMETQIEPITAPQALAA